MYPNYFDTVIFLVNLPFPNLRAKSYYERQKPFFQQAARNFKLHPYFSHTNVTFPNGNPASGMWPALIHQRVKAFAQLLREEGKDDFKVEKDRCIMHKFLENNDIPMNEVYGMWRDKDQFKKDMA